MLTEHSGTGIKDVTPNIGRKGRIARASSGLLCIALGMAVWAVHWPVSLPYRWIVCVVMLAAGAFQLFEAKRGWCIMRACGIKTPM